MKLRTQRVHFMGSSNRDKELPLNLTKNVFENSYIKSQSSYYKTAQSLPPTSEKGESKTKNPFQGSHNEMETLRWNKKSKKAGGQNQWKLENPIPKLDYSSRLNEEVQEIAQQFKDKDVNMFKLNELKRTFIKNNRTRRNLKSYFEKYCHDNKVGVQQIKNIVRQYGYDISDDESKLIFQLTGAKEDGLNIDQFVDLMTKENVHFRTLRINGAFGKPREHFEEKIHLVFKNKFIQLKEAFRIYRMRGQQIDQSKFNYVMKKLDINDLVVTKAERNDLFQKFRDNKGCFNVQRLLCAIIEQQAIQKPVFPPKLSEFQTNLKAYQQQQYRKLKKSINYDFKRMSNLQYENQLLKAQQVLGQLRKLGQQGLNLVKVNGGQLNRQKFREKIQLLFQSKGVNFNKQQYDCFTSYLDYNANNSINDEDYKRLVQQNSKAAQERFDRRVRALPPPPIQQNLSSFYDQDTAISSLSKVKDKKYNPQMRVLFKQFDHDKDGYISRNEFKNKISNLSVLENWQVQNLTNYFDPEGKGYLNFKDFATKFTKGQKEPDNATQSVIKLKSQSDWISTKRSFIKEANTYSYNIPNKYSAWPERLKRTDFSMIQPPTKAGQYITEDHRFNTNEKHTLGQQMKQEKNRIYENRLRKLVAWNENNQERIHNQTFQQQKRAQANDYSLRITKETYEQHCHK